MEKDSNREVGRRRFLQSAASGALFGMVPQSGFSLASLERIAARYNRRGGTALEQLLAGNRRYVTNQLTSTRQDLNGLRGQTAAAQHPFAAVLACADSRVPVELVFDQSIGQLFVARVAGNIVTSEITASLEYAVAELGTRVLLVLGHSGCGAIKAAMHSESVPGQISSLYSHLRPAIEQSAGKVDKAVAINAKMQASLLSTSSTVVRQATSAGKLEVAAGVYDLVTGRVTLV
jgi:carbonic anhydrase